MAGLVVTPKTGSNLVQVVANEQYKINVDGIKKGLWFIGATFVKNALTSISLQFGWKSVNGDDVYKLRTKDISGVDVVFSKPDALTASASVSAEVLIPEDAVELHVFVVTVGTNTGTDTLSLDVKA